MASIRRSTLDAAQSARRTLRAVAPYGPGDLLAQIGVWIAFGLAYEAARGVSEQDRPRALADGRTLIALERKLHAFFEASLQRGLTVSSTLEHALGASYWLSEFALLVAALAYTYFRHRETYRRFRNAVLAANGLGLVGYLAYPTAPPRLFPADGFRNVLSGQPPAEHPTGLIGFAGNPYAAMPSLHVADAVLIAYFFGSLSSSRVAKAAWFVWPFWLAYVVLATGNHFWLDVAAGVLVAAAGLAVSSRLRPKDRRNPRYATLPVEALFHRRRRSLWMRRSERTCSSATRTSSHSAVRRSPYFRSSSSCRSCADGASSATRDATVASRSSGIRRNR
ncbi:MAG: phosphatase PAP2 family protein [Gaiellaceae bacterium]